MNTLKLSTGTEVAPQVGTSYITSSPSTLTWTTDEENVVLLADVCQAIDDMEGFDNVRNVHSKKNTAARVKKARMDLVNTLGFTEIDASFSSTNYSRPQEANSTVNRAFKTSARPIFIDTEVEEIVDEKFAKLLPEEDVYHGRRSGFSLKHIDGLLLINK
ncbi:Hypothetical protein CINCED_3A014563 [Cinara cedri]|uniref:Uncharacterized protein n=1 Tax=Cinara cedri TaxID=506608 RepID=A0A5E4NDF5_9HEMI|nr:Hypothetical protein CINCED_3A014563 [Cinara cedri]